MRQLLKKIFGDSNSRQLKKLEQIADQIEALEPEMQRLSDESTSSKNRRI